jgi:hypothetical protein
MATGQLPAACCNSADGRTHGLVKYKDRGQHICLLQYVLQTCQHFLHCFSRQLFSCQPGFQVLEQAWELLHSICGTAAGNKGL